jgi:hypothetical protein
MTSYRDENHRSQVLRASKARNQAMRDLSKQFPEEFRKLYEHRALELGFVPKSLAGREDVVAFLQASEDEDQLSLPGVGS